MATPSEKADTESAAEIGQSEEEPVKEKEEAEETNEEQEEELGDGEEQGEDLGDDEQEEEIGDEEGVEMFMTDNWDVVDEASGSEHDGGEIDHDLEIDDSDMPTGPEYEADGDLEDDMEASYDDEHIGEDENINEETLEPDGDDQKGDSSSAKKNNTPETEESKDSDAKSKDNKDETKTETEETADKAQAGDKDGDDKEKDTAKDKDAKKSDKEGTDSEEKKEGEEKTDAKKAEKKTEGEKDAAKSKEKLRAEAKERAEADAKARAEARAKAEARRKADHEAMTKEWDNLVVTLSDVEVRSFKADDFFLCLCKAKEIHIDFEDQNGMRTLGKMKVTFNASSPSRYDSLIKSLANLRLLGIKIDECSEHLLKRTNDFCRRFGLQEGHPRDRSLFLKNLPEDTTDLSLKEYVPNMVRACVARKPGGKVVGWAVVEMPSKSECLAFLHDKKIIQIGKHQVRVSRMTSIGKPEIPTTPRVQQWLWGKLFYLSDKRREYWNSKKPATQDSRPVLNRGTVGRFSRGNFRDNKFLNTRGRRPNIRGTGMRPTMNMGMRTNMGIPGLNVNLGAGNMGGGMGMGQSNMGNMMGGQGMGGNMGGLNMGSSMGMGNMGMASGMGGMGTGMMGNMSSGGMGMGMSGNSMGNMNMNQGMGQMGSDMRQMRSNVSSFSRSRSRDRLDDRSPSQGRGFGSDRSFSNQRQRRSTGGIMDSGRANNNRRGSSRDGGMRRTSDINTRPSRGTRGSFSRGSSYTGGRGGNYSGGRDSRSSFDSGRDGGFDRNRSPVRSRRDSGDFNRDYGDYNKGGNYSDHSDYEDDYNRGGSRHRQDDDYDRDYDRPSRSSDRMGQSSAPRRQQQIRRRERSPDWDDRDYDSHDMALDEDSHGRGVKKTASRRDLSEKLGVVLSNERQGVQDDRAMVALLQTALDAMQKKEGSKSPARGSGSSSHGHTVTSPSMRRPNPVGVKRRKPYDDDHSQMQKRPREEFSSQAQTSTMGRTSLLGSGASYSGGQASQQYRSPLQNQYSTSKASFGTARGGASRGGRGSMRGGNMRGTTRGGPSRGGAGRGGYNQGQRNQMGTGGGTGMTRKYEDY